MTTPTPTQQAEALWIRAHEHVRRGDFANAVRDLAACFKILQQLGDPRLPEVHRRWTEVHALALEDAAHQKAAAAPKAEAQRPTLEAEAEAAANAGDLEKAIALLERAAAERPDNELVRERLAELKNARPRARELGADVAAEPVEEAQLEEAFADDGIIDAVDEPVVQQPVVEQHVEQPVVEQHVEQPVVEQHVEQPVVEAHVEQPVVEQQVEQPVVEQQVEQPVVEQHVEQPVVEQQLEQPVVEQHVVEQHVEQPVVDQPDEPDEPVERTAILYAFEPAPVVVAAAEPVVDVAVDPVVAPDVAPVVEAVVEAAHEPVHQPVVGDGLDGGLSDSIDVDLASGPTLVAPGPDADIHTAATLVPAAAVELEAAVGNTETDFGDIDIDSGPGPSLTVEPMVEASVVPVAPIDDEPFTASVTAPNAAADDITSSLELATHAAHDDVHADDATATVDAGASLELNTETKEVHVGGPTASFAVEQELQAGPAIELAVEPEPATEAPLMAAEDAGVGMPSLDVEIDMGAVVSATEADELPVAVDELEVVGDDMSVEAIVTLPPQAAPSMTADALPDDPVALLETLLERIAANRRAA